MITNVAKTLGVPYKSNKLKTNHLWSMFLGLNIEINNKGHLENFSSFLEVNQNTFI